MMPLLWLSTAFLFGIVLEKTFSWHWMIWCGLIVVCLFGWLFERIKKVRFPLPDKLRLYLPFSTWVILAVVAAGALRLQTIQPVWNSADLAYYNDQGKAHLRGLIVEPPDWKDNKVRLHIRVNQLRLLDQAGAQPIPVSGDILVYLPTNPGLAYGDQVEMEGSLAAPPENADFSYKDYLYQHQVYSYMQYPILYRIGSGNGNPLLAALYRIRDGSYNLIKKLYPQPASSLLGGILLGLDNDLPVELYDNFRSTGTSHIIAISGFNIAILSSLFAILFNKLIHNRWWSLAATLASIVFYTLLVGAAPSVTRAALMGGIGLLGSQMGRRQAGVNSLAFTAAVMCLLNPYLPWDVGFQLSFAATLGLILFADPLQTGFIRLIQRFLPQTAVSRVTKLAGDYFLMTIAAQITTLPIIAYHFRQISWSSFIVNILVLPAQPLVMILGGLSLLVGWVSLPLAQPIAYCAWVPLAYTIRIVEVSSRLWNGVVTLGALASGLIWLYYALIIALRFFWTKIKPYALNLRPSLAIFGIGIASVLIWQTVVSIPDGRLHITVLNLEGGNPILIQTVQGRTLLINGSSSERQLTDHLSRRIPLFNPSLDALIIPNNSLASLQGLPGLGDHLQIRQMLLAESIASSTKSSKYTNKLLQKGVPSQIIQPGQHFDLGNHAELSILAVSEDAVAIGIQYNRFKLLIPGGVDLSLLQQQVPEWLSGVTLLALSDQDLQGKSSSLWSSITPYIFLWMSPQPAPLELPPVQPNNSNWINIFQYIGVSIASDGQNLWIETDR
jgi:competence protein ComEC